MEGLKLHILAVTEFISHLY